MGERDSTSVVAKSVPFKNTDNDFVAKEAQSAIEEARDTIVGKASLQDFASTGINQWADYGNPNKHMDEVPFILLADADITGWTFSNDTDDSDIDIEIYKNGIGAGQKVATFQVRNKRDAYDTTVTPISFLLGDRMSIFIRRVTTGTGTDPSNTVVRLTLRATSTNSGSGGNTNGF